MDYKDRIVESTEGLKDLYVPERTKHYSPVSHFDYANELNEYLKSQKVIITKEQYILQPGKMPGDNNQTQDITLFGTLFINYPEPRWLLSTSTSLGSNNQFTKNKDVTYIFGIIASHNRLHALKMYGGGELGICTNGMIWGTEFTLSQRHHGEKILESLRKMIRAGYAHVQLQHQDMNENIEKMMNIPINDGRAAEVVLNVMDKGAIAPSAIPCIWDHWNGRSEAGEKFPDRNLWSLYNAFTERYKVERVNNVYRKNRFLNEYITEIPEMQIAS